MELKSKSHTVNGFRFESKDTKAPEWFVQAIKEGRAQVTMNSKEEYITIYSTPGNLERAYVGDWVCINKSGKIYKITHEERMEAYE